MSVPILWMPGMAPFSEATYSKMDLGMAWRMSLMRPRSSRPLPHQILDASPPCASAMRQTASMRESSVPSAATSRKTAAPAPSGRSGILIAAGSSALTRRIRSSDPPSMYSRNSGSTLSSARMSRIMPRASSSDGRNAMSDTVGCHGAR